MLLLCPINIVIKLAEPFLVYINTCTKLFCLYNEYIVPQNLIILVGKEIGLVTLGTTIRIVEDACI